VAKTAKYIVALGAFLAVVSVAAGALAARRYGTDAYAASAVAAALNWAAGAAALFTIAIGRNHSWRTQSVLLAMLVRMFPVLVAALWFTQSNHPLAAAGIGGLIVVHYLAGLMVETLMSIRLAGAPATGSSDPQAGVAGSPKS
jgi:hypothetical protein